MFYINVPVGHPVGDRHRVFIRETRPAHREPFDFFGFVALSLGIGALQLMLDRGQMKDWFGSTEIWIEAAVAPARLLSARRAHRDRERPLVPQPRLLKSTHFIAGTVLMFLIGVT